MNGATPGTSIPVLLPQVKRQSTAISCYPQSGSDGGDGPLGDTSWVANYTLGADQGIEYSSNRIFASGSTSLFSFRGDQGVSTLAAQPGSSLELQFNNTQMNAFLLSGSMTSGARFTFEQFDSGIWSELYTGYGVDFFSKQLLLPVGLFKFSAGGESFSDGYSAGEAWYFDLAAAPVTVPAPASLVLLLTGLVGTTFFENARSEGRPPQCLSATREYCAATDSGTISGTLARSHSTEFTACPTHYWNHTHCRRSRASSRRTWSPQ
ncbi:MAG: hypothetical protein IPG06_19115 [Haliea sp.]|nr:hypothetical protein [Haliea sp.]